MSSGDSQAPPRYLNSRVLIEREKIVSQHFLPPFSALRAFEALGATGGIRKAAQALGIGHAIVSRHIAGLENQLGAQLFNRQTGELTVIGRDYHTKVSAAISGLRAATADVQNGRANELVIWSSPGIALLWLARRLPEFGRGRYRPVIDLRSSDIEPDFSKGEADGDIRYWLDGSASAHRRDAKVMELARPGVFPVASPTLAKQLADKVRGAFDLLACPLIQEGRELEWKAWFEAQGVSEPMSRLHPVAVYSQAHLTLAAARTGQGIALSNAILAADDLDSGALVRIAPSRTAFSETAIGSYLFRYGTTTGRSEQIKRFQSWLRQAFNSTGAGKT